MSDYNFREGDVLGFSGHNLISDGINISTFGIPRWSISHVGIIGYDRRMNGGGGLALYESTKKLGVHSTPVFCNPGRYRGLRNTIEKYNGKVWVYPLASRLSLHGMSRMSRRLNDMRDREYDVRGALQAGGGIWAWCQAVCRGEDLTSLFCSELVAEALSYAGIFRTANASRWSPNHLVRKLRRLGIVLSPRRLK